jgi:nucleotide-binding universal stress UspA family protein
MKTILAAVDSSERSQAVYKETLVLATSLQAKVVILSVTPDYEGNMNRWKVAGQEMTQPFLDILREAEEYAESLGLELQTVHKHGHPWQEILKTAWEHNASLIIMGCSKRYQFERLLLGRTASEVVNRSHCDVLFLPEHSEIRFNNILVGLSDTENNEKAVRRSFDIASSYGGKVHGIHSIFLPADRSLRYGVASDAEQKATRILDKFNTIALEYENVASSSSFCWDSEEKCLYKYCTENDIDLVIFGAPSDTSILNILSASLIEKFSSLSDCPILVTATTTTEKHYVRDESAFGAETV